MEDPNSNLTRKPYKHHAIIELAVVAPEEWWPNCSVLLLRFQSRFGEWLRILISGTDVGFLCSPGRLQAI